MKWLGCSYPELLALPDGYLDVVVRLAKRDATEARLRRRAGRR